MKYFIPVMVFLLCGCQTIMEEYKKQMLVLCTYDGAYSKGVEHAENQEGSQASSVLANCGSSLMPQALRGYNDGYASLSQTQERGGQGSSSYICEIEVFTDKFSDKGRSKAEALHNAKTKCSANRHDGDFFCNDTSEYECKKLY